MERAERRKVAKPLPGRSFAEVFPEMAKEAFEWDPTTASSKSNVKQRWKCIQGHVYECDPAHRTSGRGCPYCANKKVLKGFNDIATTHPLLALEADGWDPAEYSFGTGKRLTWKCSVGHVWTISPNSRTTNDSGCPICGGKLTLPGYNDLLTINPELAAQAHGWDPSKVAPRSAKSYEWKCEFGHIWESSLTNRSRGDGCPVCINKKILPGFNDIATLFPEVAAQAHGWDPTKFSVRSSRKMTWRCEFGHIWKVAIAGRTPPNSSGCPFCTGRFAIVGKTDMATTHPELAVEADGWDPASLKAYSNKKVGWKCHLGHTWRTAPASRAAGSGCPSCSIYGFDPNKHGYLYFLEHYDWHMFQIGITNYPTERLKSHAKIGWTILELRGPMDGHLTRALETGILRALRKRGALFANKSNVPNFDGWAEAWMTTSLKVASIKDLLEFVYSDDQKT
jgi:hypothetical protein